MTGTIFAGRLGMILACLAMFAPAFCGALADDGVTRAQSLLELARKNKLTANHLDEAAGLLQAADPFARGIAEWVIATKVVRDNGGQTAMWPKADPPGWYRAWSSLDARSLLENDYVRQATVWGIHRDGARLLASVDKIIGRAKEAAKSADPVSVVARSPDRATHLTEGLPIRAKRRPSVDRVAWSGDHATTSAVAERQLARLASIRERLAQHIRKAPDDLTSARRLWIAARMAARPIVLANRALDFEQLLFVKRHPGTFPNITGSQYPWGHKPGGDIYVQTGLSPGDQTRAVIDGQLGPGHVHGMDLWWNADRVVFGYARQPDWPPKWDTISGDHAFKLRGDQEPTHLFEIGLDGTGLRQITNHHYWSDFEPTYCADGDIAFSSDRSGRSSECGKFSADHTVINIYAVSPDGKNLRRLSDNKDIDRYPHSLADGRIAYTRWEYQERHFFETHAIWTVRPDGTYSEAVFNQHLRAPFGLRDTRSVPGTSKLISIATGHHTLSYGPVVIVDERHGIDSLSGLQVVTPGVKPQEGPMAGETVPQGGVHDHGGVYQTPWAISEECFLVAYSYSSNRTAGGFALYLIDVYGNKELVHRDPVLSCAFPMPLRKRTRPPLVCNMTNSSRRFGTCYVTDVYEGLEGVERGEVKSIRISQRVGWPLDEKIGAMRWIPGNAWEKRFGFYAWAPVRVIGEVPVEADGSAHFRVPVDTAVYFQILDSRHMELRRMRSHVTFQPGEVRGCVGCHETRSKSPAQLPEPPLALHSKPHDPVPPPWGADRLLGYEWLVQPIFDRRCVGCHGTDRPEANLDLTSTRTDEDYFQSFRTLFQPKGKRNGQALPLVSVSDRLGGAVISQPGRFGSHRSRLIQVLLNDELHRKEAALSDDEWLALVTWIDANAPYHDKFYNRRPADGGAPRREITLDRTVHRLTNFTGPSQPCGRSAASIRQNVSQ